jgi:hypothetical protein
LLPCELAVGILDYPARLLTVRSRGLAALDCNSNLTIRTAEDAKEIRDNCRRIEGDVTIHDVTENTDINLDGVETITGRLGSFCVKEGDCEGLELFNLTASFLTEVQGSIYFDGEAGLQSLNLPKLQTIKENLILVNLANLTSIDLGRLEHAGGMMWDTPALESLKMGSFQGPSDGNRKELWYYVDLLNVGKIDSVDMFFQNPNGSVNSSTSAVTLSTLRMPNVEHVNFAWEQLYKLTLGNMSVTLGGPETKSMKMAELDIPDGTADIQRSKSLEKLEVETFTMKYNHHITEVNLPFDQVSSLEIDDCPKLASIALPEEAKNWKNVTMKVSGGDDLVLSTEPDENGNQWHWPEGEMYSVKISANMAEGFLESMPKVTHEFYVTDRSGKLDCSDWLQRYYKKHGVTPNNSCTSLDSAGVVNGVVMTLQVAAAVSAAFMLLL